MNATNKFSATSLIVISSIVCVWPGPSLRAADCNTNGREDALDIAGATSYDCNTNSVPDECDLSPADQALRFDGADDRVVIPNRSAISFDAADNFTIEIWVGGITSTLHSEDSILEKWSGSTPYPYALRLSPSGRVRFRGATGSGDNGYEVESTRAVNDGLWHHVAATRQGTQAMRLYIDGVASGVLTNYPTSPTGNAQPISLGARGDGSYALKGKIDEVRIWNTVRTQQQIQDNRNVPLTGSESGLVGYWRLDEQSGQVVNDSSPTANNGTLGANGQSSGDLADPVRIAGHTATVFADCDSNGVIDDCDLLTGDCNSNQLLDPCELTAGPNGVEGTIRNPVNGHNYLLISSMNWNSVQQQAQSLGGQLVTIRSEAENQWLVDTFAPRVGSNWVYIGFNDRAVEGNWVWTSGEPVTFTKWGSAEPNNAGGGEDAGLLALRGFDAVGTGDWFDAPTYWSSPAIVEFIPMRDCNHNDILDECDIAGTSSADCNDNGMPDECEFGGASDCNSNGEPDLCEPGGNQDCNTNDVSDLCDIAAGADTDCNENGIPDLCDPGIGLATFGRWTFNEGAGTIAGDSSGNGRDGVLTGGASWIPGRQGEALHFDGNDDYVEIPDTTAMNFPEGFSLEAWVRYSQPNADSCLIGKHITGYGNGYILGLVNSRPHLYVSGDDGGRLVASQSYQDGQWHHIIASYDGWNMSLFVDGVSMGSIQKNFTSFNTANIRIGGATPGSQRSSFAGDIDEVIIRAGANRDCNNNGSLDACDVASGSSNDCNSNEIPDDCEPDCNSNSVADDCDTAGGDNDCNTNGTPDECEDNFGDDCNSNGVTDFCEPGGTTDCNSNGVIDLCDLLNGVGQDCNGNGKPDTCDIAAGGGSTDVNANTIPDDCELDIRVIPVVTLLDPALTSEARNGEPSSRSSVARGSTYYVEIWASDLGGNDTGLTGVYVDVAFCAQATAQAVEHGNTFITFPSGEILEGEGVDEFGGSALPSGGGIAPQWVRVGWITTIANNNTEDCTISLQPSSSGIAARTRGLIPWAFIGLGATTLTVTPPAKPYDLDDSGIINVGDLGLFADSWLSSVPPADTAHDFDCDDAVGVADLSWFATGWLKNTSDPTIVYPPCSTEERDGGGYSAGDGAPRGEPGSAIDADIRIVALAAPSASDTRTSLPASLRAVTPGQSYYLEVWATDLGDVNTGFTSVYVDLIYPAASASVLSIAHGSTFTVFPTGQANGAGLIDELGGSSLPGGVGITPQWVRIAAVRVSADQATPAALYDLAPSATGVAARARGGIPWQDVTLGSLSVTHGQLGDIDGDGGRDSEDVVIFQAALIGMDNDPLHRAASDLNGDGTADGRDIAPFIAALLGG